MSLPTPAAVEPLRALRTTVGAVMGGLVVVLLVLGTVLGWDGYPPTWVAWALGGLAVLAHVVATTAGYRVGAIAPGTGVDEAAATARAEFQRSLFVRLALCEAVGVVSVPLAFVVEPRTAKTVLVGVVLSLLLLAWHAWPSDRVVDRVERALDRAGGSSHLGDVLRGREPGRGGALLS